MDDIGSHVSMKIRSAIKAKLVELGIYVDNELPDYIMVLVVNKKTKEQMDNDLSLFLGHNTEHFTSWLTNVLEKLSSAAAASNAAVAIAAPPKEKSIEKDLKPKEEVKSVHPPAKEEVKKMENKKIDPLSVIKDTKEKDKKKSKEKKHEKKEKKRKKKEKKELERKLKKEAKKKAALEAQEKSVKETNGTSALAITTSAKSVTSAVVTEIKNSIPVSSTEGRVDAVSSSKRKRDTSDSDKEGDRAAQSPVATKRAVVEAHGAGGKHKTLTITKTIHNDHHKPHSGKDSTEERSPSALAKSDNKALSPSSTPSSTTPAKKVDLALDRKKGKSSSSNQSNSSNKVEKKKTSSSVVSGSKQNDSEVNKAEHEEFIDEIEEEVEEEEVEEDEVGEADKQTVEEEEEEEEEVEVEDEVVEEHIEVEEDEEEEEVEEEEEEEEIEETVEDIVDMKVDASDELEQEIQEDGEKEITGNAGPKQTAAEKHKERKSSKPSRTSMSSSSSSKRQSKPVSVMDRLGPPRHSKRARSSERRSDDRDRRSNDRHSADDESSKEAKAAKRRLVNLLEESSFPPRRLDKKPVSSKVVASIPPCKRLEARVRPMSVVERSGRIASSSPPRAQLASVVARHSHQHQGSGTSASGSDEESLALPTSTSTLQSKVEVSSSSSTGRDRRSGGGGMQSSSSSTARRAPNSSLILRAVADAHRSVTTAKRTNAHLGDDPKTNAGSGTNTSSKKPKLEVFSRSYREREEGRLTNSSSALKEAKIKKLSITVANAPRSAVHKENHSVADMADVPVTERLGRSSRSAAATLSKRLGERVESSSRGLDRYRAANDSIDDDGDEEVTTTGNRIKARLHNPASSTVMTVAPAAHHNMEEVEEYIEEVEEWEEDVESVDRASISDPVGVLGAAAPPSSALLLPLDQLVQQSANENKYTTRCMFWPACRLGEKCQYQHPTLPCKMFPNCNFGDKCLYIHPNCKYDALCSRVDCPFTHASPRSLSSLATPIPAKSKLSLSSVPAPGRPSGGVMSRRCHYGLKCANVNCPFLHPKPCKYGSGCLTPGCQFSHPDFTTGAKLKWVAPKVAAAAAAASAADSKIPPAPGKDGAAASMTYTASTVALKAPSAKVNSSATEWKKSSDALLAAKSKLADIESSLAESKVKRSTESDLTSNGCSTVKANDEIVKPKITPITAD